MLARIVADIQGREIEGRGCPECGSPEHVAAAILADPRFAEMLAQGLRCVDVLEGYPWEGQVPPGWRHRKLAEDIARSLRTLEQLLKDVPIQVEEDMKYLDTLGREEES